MDKNLKDLIRFYMILPRNIAVEIHRADEGGFWARVKNVPGCVTQAENFLELVEMINDAVFTYFEVPRKLRNGLGFYVPQLSQKIKEKIKKRQIEKLVGEIVQKKGTMEFSRT